jgi:hypothetical protein
MLPWPELNALLWKGCQQMLSFISSTPPDLKFCVEVFVLYCVVLCCVVLCCVVLCCVVLSCLVLSCLVWSCLVLSCLILSCPVSSCLILPNLVLPNLVLPNLVLPNRVLSCLVLSCPVLSCLVLSCFYLSSCLFLFGLVFFFSCFLFRLFLLPLSSLSVWLYCINKVCVFCLRRSTRKFDTSFVSWRAALQLRQIGARQCRIRAKYGCWSPQKPKQEARAGQVKKKSLLHSEDTVVSLRRDRRGPTHRGRCLL